MTLAITIFVIVFLSLIIIRRGGLRFLWGAARNVVDPTSIDAPPTASGWEKRLLADSLDEHRREQAKAKLFAEMNAISSSRPQPVAPAQPTTPPAASPAPIDPFA
jgi:hypothetical protein